MTNKATFSFDDLMTIAGPDATHLDVHIHIEGIGTDSRTIEPTNAFVALQGETFDGHDHVVAALGKGCPLAVVSRNFFSDAPSELRSRLLPCDDTLTALGILARYHRCRFDIPVIAIAGAAGKTSTKELVAHVLSEVYNVHYTKANYNNRVGTPLTLLGIDESHDVAVIEIGTNEPGEIADLSSMVMPTHGLITNIGKEHLEKLIDLDGVEREETSLFHFLDAHGGLLLVNMDDVRLRKFAVPSASPVSSLKVVSFGIDAGGNINPVVEFNDQLNPTFSITAGAFTFRVSMQTHGLAAARNAVAAMAVAWSIGMTAVDTRRALASYKPTASHGYARLVVEQGPGYVVLNDTYNANPESTALALDTLHKYNAGTKVAILGDMLELGEAAAEEHDSILKRAAQLCDVVVVMGDNFAGSVVRLHLDNAVHAESHETCASITQKYLDHHTHTSNPPAILVKGSRGLGMETVVHILLQGH